jgi:site-specific recombinase XerD
MTVDSTTIRAAQQLIAQLGLSPDDLLWTPPAAIPTIADYLPHVQAAEGPGARRTYSTYWDRILDAFGDRRLDQITATDIETLLRHVMATTVTRRNHQHGHYAGEHLIAAIRAIYTHAINDELLPAHRNPAAKVGKPRRPPSGRRALYTAELAAIYAVAVETGSDAPLDSLLLRLHTETACRRAAALHLTDDDIDPEWCLLRLHEKNNIIRWQPASPTLIAALLRHRDQRGGGDPAAPLLRYRDGTPLTTRRYDHLWHRIGTHLPWVAKQGITTLAPPHHPHLGRTPLRLRHRPLIRRPPRQNRQRHTHLPPRRHPRPRHRSHRTHRRVPPPRPT